MANSETDSVLESRKSDHLDLTLKAQMNALEVDSRFYYEPIFNSHPKNKTDCQEVNFLGKSLKAPIWISSMTGGTGAARHINQNLARACGEFGLGMGLGSCRSLLTSQKDFNDFALRDLIGDSSPFYSNLGISQVEELVWNGEIKKIESLVESLSADGLIIHLNPLQEWFQPEGDKLNYSALETIKKLLEESDLSIIVKEVGQGMGPASLEALMRLPLKAIEFGAFGGTNFSKLESIRDFDKNHSEHMELTKVGHHADEMVELTNTIINKLGTEAKCQDFIISGGVSTFLQGYYLIEKSQGNAIYGQAKAFLSAAGGDYSILQEYILKQIEGISMAEKFLTVRKESSWN